MTKIPFREIFKEDGEKLILQVDVEVKGELYSAKHSFTEKTMLNKVNFHGYRYLDLAVEVTGNVHEIVGFYPSD